MTSFETTAVAAAPPAAATRPFVRSWVPALFAVTLFVSALLLFAVQPMFTKMVLPKLGGSPSVWSVAMVAFQSFLFIGYLYAHLLARVLSPGRAAMVHLALLAAIAASLPLGIAHGFDAPPPDGVMLWLIALFAASIGLPFIALSATAPLLQNWFVATGHPQATNPYVLYAASNLGSFVALLAYRRAPGGALVGRGPRIAQPYAPGVHRPGMRVRDGAHYPRHRVRWPGYTYYYDGWWYAFPWWIGSWPYYDDYYEAPVYGGYCEYWNDRCALQWGFGSSDYYGCMRYHRCY
jgi:hypothetical protein